MPRNSVVRLTDHPNMTLAVDWDVKQQHHNNSGQEFTYFSVLNFEDNHFA
ncbi:MAG: hypothetical protein AB2693_29720 [Candidatus Thiodiazotropha sp.]